MGGLFMLVGMGMENAVGGVIRAVIMVLVIMTMPVVVTLCTMPMDMAVMIEKEKN